MDESSYRDHLKRGVWMCLVTGSKCSSCKEGKRVLIEVAMVFEGRVRFCLLKDGWKYTGKRKGSLVLLPDQGESRIVDYNDELSATALSHFLWYFLAEKVSLAGDQDGALVYLEQAAASKPNAADVHFKIGYIYHTHRQDLVKAVQHYEKAMGGGSTENAWNLKYMAGNAYLTLGYLEKARRMYEDAIKINPSSLSPYKEASIAARLAGNHSLSSSYLRKCLELQPKDADALAKMAEILVGEATEMAQEEARLQGSDRLPVWMRQEKQENSSTMEKLREAEALLLKSVSYNPTSSESRFLLGTVLKMLGRKEEAQQHFRQSVSLRDQGQSKGDSPARGKKKRRKMKVFVYDIHPQWNSAMLSLNMQQCRNSIYAAEVYIHEQLLLSDSLTLDPGAADLFFIPLYAACFLSSHFVRPGPGWPDNDVDIGKTYQAVQLVLEHVRQTYPFFDRSAGADHVLVLSSDWGSCQGPFLELHNSILLVTSGDRTLVRPAWYAARAADHMGSSEEFAVRSRLPCFQLFKDVVIPPLVPHPALTASYMGERTRGRDILVYFRGTAAGSVKALLYNKDYSLGIRQLLLRRYSRVRGWVVSDRINSSSYHDELLRSVFCLAPAGWELWSVRFFEAILLGCIPVLLTDDVQLPFQQRLDYSRFTVKVEQRRILELESILSSINETVIRRKQEGLKEVWKRMTYQRPPEDGDAFTGIMDELARRVETLGKTPAGGWT
ncbi:hypothetical protein GUITHDRAFT_104038 [Guillardia theta CCMP2712]|uniref:Exostosin GT47 domain-containing protein n=2 Tax=Guillardia theta TaxID=55529 RepID=L1JPN0_GUITC|nr:hypothetical protein GUITHDRAFT_104038 [Guillardia theta CCMP2712]EKX50224.1 hypothetical protein GUITHDRAFT_104038 [Guillardia theta CCMP2712]|eukprot:XP_005837204.1 hypothetical protein GUITHDRAFT_104038 [Guillardia theta CCMP2712]